MTKSIGLMIISSTLEYMFFFLLRFTPAFPARTRCNPQRGRPPKYTEVPWRTHNCVVMTLEIWWDMMRYVQCMMHRWKSPSCASFMVSSCSRPPCITCLGYFLSSTVFVDGCFVYQFAIGWISVGNHYKWILLGTHLVSVWYLCDNGPIIHATFGIHLVSLRNNGQIKVNGEVRQWLINCYLMVNQLPMK